MINSTNSNNRENCHNSNSSSDTKISKSRRVNIYHADAKPVLYAMAFNTVALAILAVGFILAMTNMKKDIEAVDAKVAGIVIGLSTHD